MTTDSPRQNPGDPKTLLEIKDLLDRADRLEAAERLEAEECRLNSSTGGCSAGKKISYAEFMARRAGISLEEQERRMGLAPQAGRAKGRG
jgi:hypothetical protein